METQECSGFTFPEVRAAPVLHPGPNMVRETQDWEERSVHNPIEHEFNKYGELQKVRVTGVKYFEPGLPSFPLTYMPAMFTSGFQATARSNVPDQL